MLFKRKKIVVSQKTKDAKVLVVWSVVWGSHRGNYSSDIETYKEFFTEKEDAEAFKKSLIDSAKILKYGSLRGPWLREGIGNE